MAEQTTTSTNELSISKKRKLLKKDKTEKRKKLENSTQNTDLNVLSQTMLMAHKNKEKDKKLDLLNQIIEIVKERFTNISHTSACSRSLQLCLKYGTVVCRKNIWELIKGDVLDLSQTKYSHKLLMKMFNYGDKNIKQEITQTLMSQPDVFYTSFGAIVWEFVYTHQNNATKQKEMLEKIFLPRLLLLKLPNLTSFKSFDELIKSLNTEHTNTLKTHLFEIIQKCVDKELLNKSTVHTLLRYYMKTCNEEEISKAMELINEGIINLSTTKDGVEVQTRFLGYSTAKQRKSLIKGYKGKFYEMCVNPVDYLLILRLICVTDDTKLINSTIIKEITTHIKDLCLDKNGSKIILQILSPFNKSYLTQADMLTLQHPAPTSVKDQHTRYKELQDATIPLLHIFLRDNYDSHILLQFMKNVYARNILVELIKLGKNRTLIDQFINQIKVDLEDNTQESIINNNIGQRTLTMAIQQAKQHQLHTSEGTPFCDALCVILKDHLSNILTSRSVFILLDCLKQMDSDNLRKEVKSKLDKNMLKKSRESLLSRGKKHVGLDLLDEYLTPQLGVA